MINEYYIKQPKQMVELYLIKKSARNLELIGAFFMKTPSSNFSKKNSY